MKNRVWIALLLAAFVTLGGAMSASADEQVSLTPRSVRTSSPTARRCPTT